VATTEMNSLGFRHLPCPTEYPASFKRDFNGAGQKAASECVRVCVCTRTLRGKLKWPQVAGVKKGEVGVWATKMPLGQSGRLCRPSNNGKRQKGER